MNSEDQRLLAAYGRLKLEQAKMEATLDGINKGVTTSVNGLVSTSGTVSDPVEAAGLKGERSYQLAGGGWRLALYESVDGMDVIWERFLDCAFVEPWKTPQEKRAQSIAIQSVLRCMFTSAKNAGLTATLYTKAL